MSFREIDVPSLGRMSQLMAHPSGDSEAALEKFREHGGNCIHLHDEGDSTQGRLATSRWLRRRDRRENIFLCAAICHDGWDEAADRPINRFTTAAVVDDIARDLDLIGTRYFDLVYLHDNPSVPFEPVLDALAHEAGRGRIRALGASNWSAGRLRAAAAYLSRRNGPRLSAVITTELSLARADRPLWPEYLPFDAALANAVRELGLAVFAHLGDFNQGQCLFGDEDAIARLRPEWIRRWQHPANPPLVQRVNTFASERGLTTREVNIAWVLNQPFPVVGIVSASALLTPRAAEYERASLVSLDGASLDRLQRLAGG